MTGKREEQVVAEGRGELTDIPLETRVATEGNSLEFTSKLDVTGDVT